MPRRSLTSKARSGVTRLGPVFHRLRIERSIPARKLSKETGLSSSYLSYLERGRFQEIGLDKFARLILALKISADQVLAEAGYLPKHPANLPDTESYLRDRYKLSGASLETATAFLEFLARQQRRRRAEPETRRRKR